MVDENISHSDKMMSYGNTKNDDYIYNDNIRVYESENNIWS
jgi:N-acetylneuraminic acid mutarotase